MMIYSRRDLGRMALASIPLAKALAAVNSKFDGVQIGAITYSFRGTNDLDAIIQMMVRIGLSEAELMSNDAEGAAGAPSQGRGGPAPARGPGAEGRGGPRGVRPPMTEAQIAAARAGSQDLRKWRLAVSMDKFNGIVREEVSKPPASILQSSSAST